MVVKELITIDLGNSNKSFMLHKGEDTSPKLPLIEFQEYLNYYKISEPQILVSDVSNNREIFSNYNNTHFVSDLIKNVHFLDMPIEYATTIGADRICQIYYAYKKFGNAIVFDSGTFTTVDYVSVEGHRGGNIYPGLELLIKSFNAGANLDLKFEEFLQSDSENIQISHNTKEAMINATKHLYSLLLKEIIAQDDHQVILSGGASEMFKHLADKHSHVHYSPNFIHESLHFIGESLNEATLRC